MSLVTLKNSDLKTIVDNDLFEYLSQWKWKLVAGGYVGRAQRLGGRKGKLEIIMLHRVINETPDNLLTDHINGNKLDNRRSNLRSVTHAQNMANRRPNKTNKLGIKGVWQNKSHPESKNFKKIWQATIYFGGKIIRIGSFYTIEEAEGAYISVASQLRGEFAFGQNNEQGAIK